MASSNFQLLWSRDIPALLSSPKSIHHDTALLKTHHSLQPTCPKITLTTCPKITLLIATTCPKINLVSFDYMLLHTKSHYEQEMGIKACTLTLLDYGKNLPHSHESCNMLTLVQIHPSLEAAGPLIPEY